MRIPALALILVAIVADAGAQENPVSPPPRVKLAWDRFYDYGEMVDALRRLQAAHPRFLELRSIGKSTRGRDLWLAVVADPDGPPRAERPAMYIDANVHGNEIQGTEVCLYTIWYLLENRESLPRIGRLLSRLVFYIVPSVNPDGRESWFHDPTTAHAPRSGLAPYDDDRDGEADEDGPDDLDGDGSITRMWKRVESGGTHLVDPEDPRRMIPAPPGREGTHLALGWEGIDNDGDGEVNEDGPGGYDMNRNFPGDWLPRWLQYGAGDYPLCHPETRAVAEFLLEHRNVVAVQSYHNAGGMILRGPGHRPPPDYPAADLAVYDEMGRVGERMLPHYEFKCLGGDLYVARGTFVSWAFEGLGAFSFTNELWSRSQYGDPGSEGEGRGHGSRSYRWDDEMEHGRHLTPLSSYRHPLYGEIEVGGLRKSIGRVPPTFMLAELCHRNAAFTLYHADQAPLLRLGSPEYESLGGGFWRIRAEVGNDRLLPTRSAYARRHGLGLPDFFEIDVENGEVVAGGLLSGPLYREATAPQPYRPHRLRVEAGVGSRGRVRVEWIVAAPGAERPTVKLRYVSEKGGVVTRGP